MYITAWVHLIFYAFDILVSTFLRYCVTTLIAPKVLISRVRVRFIFPSLTPLQNVLSELDPKSEWVSSILRLEISRDLGKVDNLVTFASLSTKMSYDSLGPRLGNNLSIPQHKYEEFMSYSYRRVLQLVLSLCLLLGQRVDLQIPTLETHILHFCFDLLTTCALWVLQHMSRNCVQNC